MLSKWCVLYIPTAERREIAVGSAADLIVSELFNIYLLIIDFEPIYTTVYM